MADEQTDRPTGDPEAAGMPDRPLDPEKLLRLAGLVKAVLDEVRSFDAQPESAAELAGLHHRVTAQIGAALPNVLRDELAALDLGLDSGAQASGQDVRVAYAGLIGWLGGLFQGLQASIQAQQIQGLQAMQQLHSGEEQHPTDEPAVPERHSGMYL